MATNLSHHPLRKLAVLSIACLPLLLTGCQTDSAEATLPTTGAIGSNSDQSQPGNQQLISVPAMGDMESNDEENADIGKSDTANSLNADWIALAPGVDDDYYRQYGLPVREDACDGLYSSSSENDACRFAAYGKNVATEILGIPNFGLLCQELWGGNDCDSLAKALENARREINWSVPDIAEFQCGTFAVEHGDVVNGRYVSIEYKVACRYGNDEAVLNILHLTDDGNYFEILQWPSRWPALQESVEWGSMPWGD